VKNVALKDALNYLGPQARKDRGVTARNDIADEVTSEGEKT
jgi:hypothetical protein